MSPSQTQTVYLAAGKANVQSVANVHRGNVQTTDVELAKLASLIDRFLSKRNGLLLVSGGRPVEN